MKYLNKKGLLSLLLALSLFITSIPLSSQAKENENVLLEETETELIDGIDECEEESKDAVIIEEVIEKRKEAQKTYLLSDGSYLVAYYQSPVHYQDEDGSWQEIDNGLIAESESEESDLVTTKDAGDRKVRFSNKIKEKKTVTIKEGDYEVSWGFAEAKNTKANKKEKKEKKNDNNDYNIENQSQRIVYEEAYDKVDIEYILTTSSIKENIYLKDVDARSSFVLNYELKGLTAVAVDEKTIHLMDGEEIIYEISAPYMYDATGAVSDALSLSITEEKNGKLTVKVSADEEWLKEEERVYPVIIDPYITTERSKSAIDSTFIASKMADTNFSTYGEMVVGLESSAYGYCRTLVQFELPDLEAGDMIVSASLNMFVKSTGFYAASTPELQINVHQITESWEMEEVTWKNKPDYESAIISDYGYITREDTDGSIKTFDITKVVKGWQEGVYKNYGLYIKSYAEPSDISYATYGVKEIFYPERYNDDGSTYPVLFIGYRNNKGIEDYWSYTPVSAGAAGEAYINDYTGNLVFFHTDAGTNGNLLPVSISHVYNGYKAGKQYTKSYPYSGKGFQLSLQQTVLSSEEYGLTGASLEAYPYAYEDGDGTVHFFYKVIEDGEEKYYDEDGLGLELTLSKSGKIITDAKDNTLTFNAKGNLSSIKDATGNKITLSYTNHSDGTPMLYKVTDGAGHVISITTDSTTKCVSSITDPSGTISFTYNSSGYLTKITYPDGNSSQYTYTSSKLTKAIASDGSYLSFSYTTAATGSRVKAVTEYGSDGKKGQSVTFDRTEYNTTKIKTSGADDVLGTADDITTTLQFDNYGRTISSESKNASGESYGGGIYTYTAGKVNSSASNIKKLNRIDTTAYTTRIVNNLLENSSAESSGSFEGAYLVNPDCVYSVGRSSSVYQYGSKSFYIKVTEIAANGGGAYYQEFTTDTLKRGKSYTISGRIKATNLKKGNDSVYGYGAGFCIRFVLEDGTVKRLYSPYITDSRLSEDGWEQLSYTFVMPTNAESVRVSMIVKNAVGTAYFDGLQLEEGESASEYNLINHPSFEKNNASGWSGSHLTSSTDGVVSGKAVEGTYCYKIKGEADKDKVLYQNVSVNGVESDVYVVSCYAKADAVPDGEEERNFEIYAKIYYADGSSVIKSSTAEFNRAISSWQRASMAFNLGNGISGDGLSVIKIQVGIRFYKQVNTVYIDGMQLLKDTRNIYTYDSEGNLITATENGANRSAFTYNDASDLTAIKDGAGNTYTYTYNDAHQVTKAATPGGQTIHYVYTSTGLIQSTTLKNKTETMGITNEVSYTKADSSLGIKGGAYLSTQTDENGNKTSFDYDLETGLLESVTTANGATTEYRYESDTKLLSQVSDAVGSVDFSYHDESYALERIDHNGFTYLFSYDGYKNVKSVQVQGSTKTATNTYTLLSYSYAENNGKLTTLTYGNGDALSYTYNEAGLLESESKNGEITGAWIYDASGIVTQYQDYRAKQNHSYFYDFAGRISGKRIYDATITSTAYDNKLYESHYSYDSLNRLSKESIVAGGSTHSSAYTYNENGQVETVTYENGNVITYKYDTLGRLNSKITDTEQTLNVNYIYWTSERNKDGESFYRTTQIKRELLGDYGYSYEYDAMGNLVAIGQGNRLEEGSSTLTDVETVVTYHYDERNQLLRENHKYLDKTIIYSYDEGGNLLEKKIYSYTDKDILPSEAELLDTISYGYELYWKDRLSSYDGKSIRYDAIGNPTIYKNARLSWEARSLESYAFGNVNLSYDYNAEGLRTVKTGSTAAGNLSIKYFYEGSQLVYEERGDVKLYYSYDGYGNLSKIDYVKSGTKMTYYVLCNSRGDVDGICEEDGTLICRYIYDSWGVVLSVQNPGGVEITDETHIGNVNPIRYRGYYYDAETGLYYVSSRYYDPENGRWISPEPNVYAGVFDSGSGLIGYNVYAYCANNPVNYYDPTGEFVISTLLICVAAGAIIGGTIGGIAGNAYANSKGYTGWDKTKSILTGIGIGGLAGGALGYFAAPAVVSATGVAGISITSGGISTIAALGTSFGKLGTLIANNGQQIIDWGKTTWHGMQRMIERGVTQNMVEVWAKTGKALQQAGGKILYITKQGAVVIDKAGKVITAYTSQYFDPAMQKVVEKLFGK